MQNPLLPQILAALKSCPAGISEHQLLKWLDAHPAFADLAARGNLALFQRHFMLMNALYQLQKELWDEEGLVLEVSPLSIGIVAVHDSGGSQLDAAANSAVRDYYLDWCNFSETGEAAVSELLTGFWRRFQGGEGRAAALMVLDLPADAGASTTSRRYRELAARHHPDKGGDPAVFVEIRQAYERLKDRK